MIRLAGEGSESGLSKAERFEHLLAVGVGQFGELGFELTANGNNAFGGSGGR